MKIMYIAAPFRGPHGVAIADNIAKAQLLGALAIAGGYMPLIPQANTAVFHGFGPDQLYLDGTMELMRRCDAVLYSAKFRMSQGVAAELKEAERLQMPIYRYDGFAVAGSRGGVITTRVVVGRLEDLGPQFAFTFPSFH